MPNIQFYMTPGSCSTGLHILLAEAELIFEAHIIDLPKGDNLQPEYLAINPKGTIPALVTKKGQVITDFAAIAYWISQQPTGKHLWPEQTIEQVRALEVMNYAVNTIHMQGFTRIFTPEHYQAMESQQRLVLEKQGKVLINKCFTIVNNWLSKHDYVTSQFSIADAALFYVEFWAQKLKMTLPKNCQAHYQRMLTRNTVKQVLMEEGYHRALEPADKAINEPVGA